MKHTLTISLILLWSFSIGQKLDMDFINDLKEKATYIKNEEK